MTRGSWFATTWNKLTSWLRPNTENGQQVARAGHSGKVFVYGTLRRGQLNEHLLREKVTHIEEATIPGLLYDLGDGSHAVIAGLDRVAGQLLTFADVYEALTLLDEIEGVDLLRNDNFFKRVELLATTEDGNKHTCYAYVCAEEKRTWLKEQGKHIPSDETLWEPDETLVPYFAYGSCMSETDFNRTVPEFEVMGMAKLPGYRVAFTLYANSRKGGVADIVKAEGEVMEGVLYRFPKRYLKRLDKREGVPHRVYERIKVEVCYDGIKVPVWTYAVVNKEAEEIPPSQVYRDIIMDGAEAVLSEKYAKELQEKMDRLMGIGK